jgi:hypothetical protein
VDLDEDRHEHLLAAGGYEDMPGVLAIQLTTTVNGSQDFYPHLQGNCNVIYVYDHYENRVNQTLTVNGTITLNITGCVLDFNIIDWDDDGFEVGRCEGIRHPAEETRHT